MLYHIIEAYPEENLYVGIESVLCTDEINLPYGHCVPLYSKRPLRTGTCHSFVPGFAFRDGTLFRAELDYSIRKG